MDDRVSQSRWRESYAVYDREKKINKNTHTGILSLITACLNVRHASTFCHNRTDWLHITDYETVISKRDLFYAFLTLRTTWRPFEWVYRASWVIPTVNTFVSSFHKLFALAVRHVPDSLSLDFLGESEPELDFRKSRLGFKRRSLLSGAEWKVSQIADRSGTVARLNVPFWGMKLINCR